MNVEEHRKTEDVSGVGPPAEISYSPYGSGHHNYLEEEEESPVPT